MIEVRFHGRGGQGALPAVALSSGLAWGYYQRCKKYQVENGEKLQNQQVIKE
jgi:hypothetical protein